MTTDEQRSGNPQGGPQGPHEQWDIVTGVGVTALAVAAARAAGRERWDALVDDPYAAARVAVAASSGP